MQADRSTTADAETPDAYLSPRADFLIIAALTLLVAAAVVTVILP